MKLSTKLRYVAAGALLGRRVDVQLDAVEIDIAEIQGRLRRFEKENELLRQFARSRHENAYEADPCDDPDKCAACKLFAELEALDVLSS